jgi:SOS-response transcriptional repressor LexA
VKAIEERPRDEFGRVAPTKSQLRLLRLIEAFQAAHGYAPTVRELEAKTKAKSPNAIAQKLNYLRRKGWVAWEPNRARTLRITGPLEASP